MDQAEIGVGPSIESGSQTCRGNCADLPMAPTNRPMQITVSSAQGDPANSSMVEPDIEGACANTAA